MSIHSLALERAKIKLLGKPDSVFYSSLCFSLKHVFDDSIPTAATNGLSVKYNPDFFMSLSEEARVSLLLHETLHCAYMHMSRAKDMGLNPRKANIAADFVINLQLHNRGYHIPENWLLDHAYTDMSMEQVYKILPEGEEILLSMADFLEPGEGTEKETKDGNVLSTQDIEQYIQDALIRASVQSKMQNEKPGSIPFDIQIYLDKLLNPKLPWNTILRKYMNEVAKKDFTWQRPNRRFFPNHYLPSLHSQSSLTVAVAIDTSGSVSDEDFTQFISDVRGIIDSVEPLHIDLIQFDTEIKSVDRITTKTDLAKIKFSGRGGTRIEPVMEWAITHKPKLLLVFSDGEFYLPDEYPKSNLIWVIHNNTNWKCEHGKTIHYTI